MGEKVGESKDLSILTADPLYSSYGPVALCSKIREEYHVNCCHLSGWPALATRVPAANKATDTNPPADRNSGNGDSTNINRPGSGTAGSGGNASSDVTSMGNGNRDDFFSLPLCLEIHLASR